MSADDQLDPKTKHEVELLGTLRDEIRVQMHLANLEAKESWGKLEPEILRVEQAFRTAEETGRALLKGLVKRFQDFRDSLKGDVVREVKEQRSASSTKGSTRTARS